MKDYDGLWSIAGWPQKLYIHKDVVRKVSFMLMLSSEAVTLMWALMSSCKQIWLNLFLQVIIAPCLRGGGWTYRKPPLQRLAVNLAGCKTRPLLNFGSSSVMITLVAIDRTSRIKTNLSFESCSSHPMRLNDCFQTSLNALYTDN